MNKQIFYRFFVTAAILGTLAACDARPQSELTGKSMLEALLEDGPNVTGVSDALLVTAKQAENVGDYSRAMQFYKQLVDKEPKNIAYNMGLAHNLRRLQKLDEAISIYDGILELRPNNVEALEGKGVALITKADFSDASVALEKVMMLDPKRWQTLNGVGILFVAKGLPNEAISYFDAALAQKPDHPSVLNNVGLTLAMTQDYERAFQALNRASSQVKTKSLERQRIDLNLALVLGISGDITRAEQVASKHLSGSALQNNLGFYSHLADNDELAKAYLNSALSGSPTFYERAWDNLESVKQN